MSTAIKTKFIQCFTADRYQHEGVAEEYHDVVLPPLVRWLIEEYCVEQKQRDNGASDLDLGKVE